VAGVVVAVSLGDMMLHNRRKRNEWFSVQQELYRRDLEEATEALSSGTANEDQMLLINQARAREEAELEKLNKKSVFARAKEALFSNMDKEEQKGGALGALFPREKRENTGEGVLQAVEDTVRHGKEKQKDDEYMFTSDKQQRTPSIPTTGGPLDQMGEKVANAASNSTRSWTEWALRR
jgi:hypothetical protein